ncbi:MAG: AMP-dependent synthetase/ligase [Caulobacter sp.]|nr:AMP-dependent synthetase/ligase [Caulobacter sp.]
MRMSRLVALLKGVLAIDPAADAVEFQEHWLSWGALAATMAAMDAHLTAHGLGPDARVGVVLRNRPEMIAAIAEMMRSQRCMVTLNASYPDVRLAEDVAETAVPAIVIHALDWARDAVRRAAEQAGVLVIEVGGVEGVSVRQAPDRSRGEGAWRVSASATAMEMLTSGTTGKPKRIPIARLGFETSLLEAVQYESGRSGDDKPALRTGVQILAAPFAHTAGVQAVMNVLLSGRRSCLLEKFTVEAFRGAIVRHRPKVVSATPAAVQMLVDAGVPREDLSSLVAFRTGAAALDPDLADRFTDLYGVPILQNYGATEFGGVAGWTPGDFRALFKEKRGSVGRINPGIYARVVSPETGEALAAGEQGLLELKAPHVSDGVSWLRTSDLAVLDDDRFLWIKGRADGAIVRGGFKIQPEDVATALQGHPSIREAVVVGIADARLGAAPAAAYTLVADAPELTDDALKQYLRDRLAPYQVPVRFLRLEEMPRTESMKISLVAVKGLLEA